MKIRLDFVTNSSSSSYLLSYELSLVGKVEGKNKEVRYDFNFEGKGKCPKEGGGPRAFTEYQKHYFAEKGDRIPLNRFIKSKNHQKKFIKWLNEKKGIIIDDTQTVSIKTEGNIGWGESIGNDWEMEQSYLKEHFHSKVNSLFQNNGLFTKFANGDSLLNFYIMHISIIEGGVDKFRYDFYRYDDDFDDTETAYRCIFDSIGAPKLELSYFNSELLAAGLDESDLKFLEEEKMMLMYFAHDTQKNDVAVVLIEGGKSVAAIETPDFVNLVKTRDKTELVDLIEFYIR